jgi:hypothetical protein
VDNNDPRGYGFIAEEIVFNESLMKSLTGRKTNLTRNDADDNRIHKIYLYDHIGELQDTITPNALVALNTAAEFTLKAEEYWESPSKQYILGKIVVELGELSSYEPLPWGWDYEEHYDYLDKPYGTHEPDVSPDQPVSEDASSLIYVKGYTEWYSDYEFTTYPKPHRYFSRDIYGNTRLWWQLDTHNAEWVHTDLLVSTSKWINRDLKQELPPDPLKDNSMRHGSNQYNHYTSANQSYNVYTKLDGLSEDRAALYVPYGAAVVSAYSFYEHDDKAYPTNDDDAATGVMAGAAHGDDYRDNDVKTAFESNAGYKFVLGNEPNGQIYNMNYALRLDNANVINREYKVTDMLFQDTADPRTDASKNYNFIDSYNEGVPLNTGFTYFYGANSPLLNNPVVRAGVWYENGYMLSPPGSGYGSWSVYNSYPLLGSNVANIMPNTPAYGYEGGGAYNAAVQRSIRNSASGSVADPLPGVLDQTGNTFKMNNNPNKRYSFVGSRFYNAVFDIDIPIYGPDQTHDELKNKGFEVTGIEISKELIDMLTQKTGRDIDNIFGTLTVYGNRGVTTKTNQLSSTIELNPEEYYDSSSGKILIPRSAWYEEGTTPEDQADLKYAARFELEIKEFPQEIFRSEENANIAGAVNADSVNNAIYVYGKSTRYNTPMDAVGSWRQDSRDGAEDGDFYYAYTEDDDGTNSYSHNPYNRLNFYWHMNGREYSAAETLVTAAKIPQSPAGENSPLVSNTYSVGHTNDVRDWARISIEPQNLRLSAYAFQPDTTDPEEESDTKVEREFEDPGGYRFRLSNDSISKAKDALVTINLPLTPIGYTQENLRNQGFLTSAVTLTRELLTKARPVEITFTDNGGNSYGPVKIEDFDETFYFTDGGVPTSYKTSGNLVITYEWVIEQSELNPPEPPEPPEDPDAPEAPVPGPITGEFPLKTVVIRFAEIDAKLEFVDPMTELNKLKNGVDVLFDGIVRRYGDNIATASGDAYQYNYELGQSNYRKPILVESPYDMAANLHVKEPKPRVDVLASAEYDANTVASMINPYTKKDLYKTQNTITETRYGAETSFDVVVANIGEVRAKNNNTVIDLPIYGDDTDVVGKDFTGFHT